MEEQVKQAQKVVEVVDRANRKICVILLPHSVNKPESSYVQVRSSARRKEDEKFQKIVDVNYKPEGFIYLFDAMTSAYDEVIAHKAIWNVL